MIVDWQGHPTNTATLYRSLRVRLEREARLTLNQKADTAMASDPIRKQITGLLDLPGTASLGAIVDALSELEDGAVSTPDTAAMSDREMHRLGLTRRELKICAEMKCAPEVFAAKKAQIKLNAGGR